MRHGQKIIDALSSLAQFASLGDQLYAKFAASQTLSAAQKTQALSNIGLNLQGYIGGLTLSNDGTSPNTVIDVATGVAMSDDSTTLMTLASAYTKNCNAAWAVGTGNGALDTGSTLAASTWYHVFLIERPDTGVVDVLLSTSATAPTMPASYTKKRRIGSIKTDASSHILAFLQNGDEFLWGTPTNDIGASNLSTTAVLYTLNVPAGVKVTALMEGAAYNPSQIAILLTCPDVADTAPSLTGLGIINVANTYVSTPSSIRTNTSGQIRARSTSATTYLYITTMGWIDRRGRWN